MDDDTETIMNPGGQAGRDEIRKLLRDLELVWRKCADPNTKWNKIAKQTHTDDMSRVVDAISKGQNFIEAIDEEVNQPNSVIRQIFFGNSTVESADVATTSISARDDSHRMILRIHYSKALSSSPDENLKESDVCASTVIVDTNFQQFTFTHW